jgi:hypothetical protein
MQSAHFLSRRHALKFAAGGALGLNLGGLLAAQVAGASASAAKPIRACILIFYYGGPSHLDTFDLKPAAPVEIRGEFQPISTSVPGLQICEHLPKLSRWMHKAAIIRSMSHQARLHDSASIHVLTGRPLEGPDRELFAPQPQFYPSHGGAVSYMRRQEQHVLPFAALPFEFHNVVPTPAQGGGFLGAEFDPLRIEVDPAKLAYRASMFRAAEDLGRGRMAERRQLLESLDPTHSSPHAPREGFRSRSERTTDVVARSATPALGQRLRTHHDRAYQLHRSNANRQAVEITREPQPGRGR